MKYFHDLIINKLHLLIPIIIWGMLIAPFLYIEIVQFQKKNDYLNSSNNENTDIKFKPNFELTENFYYKNVQEFIDSLLVEEFTSLEDSLMIEIDDFLSLKYDTLQIFSVDLSNDTLKSNDFLEEYKNIYIWEDEYLDYRYRSTAKDKLAYSILKNTQIYLFTIPTKNIDDFKRCFPNSVKVRVFETEKTIVVKDTLYYFGKEIINENDTLNEIFFKRAAK
jgi:hypothetical protein